MDNQYWDTYYEKRLPPVEPSQFARDMLPRLAAGKQLLDLGCGNGRDAIFFYQNGLQVLGIDQSASAIQMLQEKTDEKSIQFIQGDFVTSNELVEHNFDYVYSRFTLHSVSETEEPILLKRIYTLLKPGGELLVEARSIRDDIYGKGQAAGRNAYIYQGHYRRFLVLQELQEALKGLGMEIVFAAEKDNCAIYQDENPIVIRLCARKG